ncbi:phosphatase PAP2 family protein [Streptococcus orisratti]
MKNYKVFYDHISQPFRQQPRYLYFLRTLNGFITKLMYASYPLVLAFVFWKNSRAILAFILIPGVSFIILSLARKIINYPRPYDTWEITPLIAKDSSGQSLPSRHVFSAAVISMCLMRLTALLGVPALILSAVLAVCRVVGGVHYPRDVVVGYALGLVCGALLFLF